MCDVSHIGFTLCLALSPSFVQLFEAKLKDKQLGFNWKELLKAIMYAAGVQGRSCSLLLTEMGQKCDRMLDDVHQVGVDSVGGRWRGGVGVWASRMVRGR